MTISLPGMASRTVIPVMIVTFMMASKTVLSVTIGMFMKASLVMSVSLAMSMIVLTTVD